MTVTGKYTKEDGHIFIFTEDTIYTIMLFHGCYAGFGSVKVGDTITTQGMILTKEQFEIWKSHCDKSGTFTLPG